MNEKKQSINTVFNIELIIDNKIFYKSIKTKDKIYFEDDNSLVSNNEDKVFLINLQTKKKSLVFYCGYNTFNMTIKNYAEFISNKYQIIIFCNTNCDVIINNVKYINYKKFDKIYSKINIQKLLITDLLLILKYPINFIKNALIFPQSKLKDFKLNKFNIINKHSSFIKNVLKSHKTILFPSKYILNDFITYHGIKNKPNMLLLNYKYNLSFNLPKSKQIICYNDNNFKDVFEFFKLVFFNKPAYKLILYTSKKLEFKHPNLIIKHPNMRYRNYDLLKSNIFIITEINNLSDFYINESINAKCITLIPKFFSHHQDNTIHFDNLKKDITHDQVIKLLS